MNNVRSNNVSFNDSKSYIDAAYATIEAIKGMQDLDDMDIRGAYCTRLSIVTAQQIILSRDIFSNEEKKYGVDQAVKDCLSKDMNELFDLFECMLEGNEEDKDEFFDWFIERTKGHPMFYAAEEKRDFELISAAIEAVKKVEKKLGVDKVEKEDADE